MFLTCIHGIIFSNYVPSDIRYLCRLTQEGILCFCAVVPTFHFQEHVLLGGSCSIIFHEVIRKVIFFLERYSPPFCKGRSTLEKLEQAYSGNVHFNSCFKEVPRDLIHFTVKMEQKLETDVFTSLSFK